MYGGEGHDHSFYQNMRINTLQSVCVLCVCMCVSTPFMYHEHRMQSSGKGNKGKKKITVIVGYTVACQCISLAKCILDNGWPVVDMVVCVDTVVLCSTFYFFSEKK